MALPRTEFYDFFRTSKRRSRLRIVNENSELVKFQERRQNNDIVFLLGARRKQIPEFLSIKEPLQNVKLHS